MATLIAKVEFKNYETGSITIRSGMMEFRFESTLTDNIFTASSYTMGASATLLVSVGNNAASVTVELSFPEETTATADVTANYTETGIDKASVEITISTVPAGSSVTIDGEKEEIATGEENNPSENPGTDTPTTPGGSEDTDPEEPGTDPEDPSTDPEDPTGTPEPTEPVQITEIPENFIGAWGSSDYCIVIIDNAINVYAYDNQAEYAACTIGEYNTSDTAITYEITETAYELSFTGIWEDQESIAILFEEPSKLVYSPEGPSGTRITLPENDSLTFEEWVKDILSFETMPTDLYSYMIPFVYVRNILADAYREQMTEQGSPINIAEGNQVYGTITYKTYMNPRPHHRE